MYKLESSRFKSEFISEFLYFFFWDAFSKMDFPSYRIISFEFFRFIFTDIFPHSLYIIHLFFCFRYFIYSWQKSYFSFLYISFTDLFQGNDIFIIIFSGREDFWKIYPQRKSFFSSILCGISILIYIIKKFRVKCFYTEFCFFCR